MTPTKSRDVWLLALALLLFAAAFAGGFAYKEWRPAPATAHGRGVDGMITYLMIVTGAFFVVGHLVLIGFLMAGRRTEAKGSWKISPRAEWISALVPVALMSLAAEGGVFAIGLPVWKEVYGEPPADALTVDVVGKQFEWLVRYPGKDGTFGRTKPSLVSDAENPMGLDESDPAAADDIVIRGGLYLPAGRFVSVRIRSHDVLHSFAIPEFRTKQDAVPGLTTRTAFTAERPGKYEIVCAELCGMYHYRMRGMATVLSAEEFEKWMDRQVGAFE